VSRRPPFLVWRFILVDVWRLLLLTTAVLVTVLSFAAAVRFLADGRLGPIETVRFMLLAMPPMLQYALPFAAGFGATLAYHRWASDNEITACHAAGIGHRSILVPVAMSGLLLGGVILSLQNVIIPRFLRSMEQLVTRDAAKFIISAIDRKEAVKMGDTLVYADLVRTYPDSSDGKWQQLYLKGVLMVKLKKDQSIDVEISAEEADVWLIRELAAVNPDLAREGAVETESVTRVIVKPRNVRVRNVGQQEGSQLEYTVMSQVIPNAFNDDPKYLTWGELNELDKDPDRINIIQTRRAHLAANVTERLVTERINQELASRGEAQLVDRYGQPLVLRAGRIEWSTRVNNWWTIEPREVGGVVEVERTLEDGRKLIQSSPGALMQTQMITQTPNPTGPAQPPVTLRLSLTEAKTIQSAGSRSPLPRAVPPTPESPDRAPGGVLKEFVIEGANLAFDPAPAVAKLSSPDLLAKADELIAVRGKDEFVEKPRNELRRRIADLRLEILSKQHERLASSFACLVMIVTGAVMALRLRGKLPLTVYLWAFFPALATIMTISAGQQMTHHNGPVGLLLLWGGVTGLIAYTYLQYRRVVRN